MEETKTQSTFSFTECFIFINITKGLSKFLISKSQYDILVETAMDLDIFSQNKIFNTKGANQNLQESVYQMIQKLNEVERILFSGKEVKYETQQKLFELENNLNSLMSEIKFDN